MRKFAAALSLLAALHCTSTPRTSTPRRATEVTLAHSSGGPAPIITFITVNAAGEIVLDVSGGPVRARIDPAAALRIVNELKSERMQAVLAQLRAKGYASGCCDQQDVYIRIGRQVTEAPVWESTPPSPDDPDGEDTFAVPEELLEVFRRVDELAGAAFGTRHSYPLTPAKH